MPVKIPAIRQGSCFLREGTKQLILFVLVSNKNANADLSALQVNMWISE